jgi:hypothetical protein
MIEDFLAVARQAQTVAQIDEALSDPAFQTRDQGWRDVRHS